MQTSSIDQTGILARGAFIGCLALLAGLATPACGNHAPGEGSAHLVATVPRALTAGEVTRVTVSAVSGVRTLSVDLQKVAGQWRGTLGRIPVGTWTFHADAFVPGPSGTEVVAFTGNGDPGGYLVSAGATISVALNLQQVAGLPPPFGNQAPRIDSLYVSSLDIAPGETITLIVGASDPDPGDVLTYQWAPDDGAFSAPTNATTSWTAPATTGDYVLSVKVTDPKNAFAAISGVVHVAAANATGTVQINASFNSWPGVDDIIATPSLLAVGGTTAVQATATDADHDPLAYAWSTGATCSGTFVDGLLGAAVFTLVATSPGATTCDLRVDVSDGRGGSNFGVLTIQIGSPVKIDQGPAIDATNSTSCGFTAGDLLKFSVVAHDRDDLHPIGLNDAVYPAPGGNSLARSGGPPGGAGGRTNTYAGFDLPTFAALYWGPSGAPITVQAPGGAPVTLALESAAGGVLVFSGAAVYADGLGFNGTIPVRLTLTLGGGASFVQIPGRQVGGIDVLAAGGSFSVNIFFEANYGGWVPLNNLRGGSSVTSFSAGFYYTRKFVTPVTFAWQVTNGGATTQLAGTTTVIAGDLTRSVLDWTALAGPSTLTATATSGGRSVTATFNVTDGACTP